ncbi:MAG: TonB-dependent receptor [Bacteroidales bacterium]|nr:TonB-dependent receptor [Bacteroidales bacterium]
MKNNRICTSRRLKIKEVKFKKILRIISIISYFILNPIFITAQQEISITIRLGHATLGEILQEIKNQSRKSILYNNTIVDVYKNETINLTNAPLEEALNECLKEKNLQYKIIDDVIIIEPKVIVISDKNPDKLTQNIKGKVVDKESQMPLPGTNVIVVGIQPLIGGITDQDGNYKLKNVPIGRYNIQISYVGYEPVTVPEILVGSAKEVVINVGLKESLTSINEIVVSVRKDRPLNSMAVISARSFTVEETRRYAGSLDDPAQMVSAFAGVTTGFFGDNAIVIRGNSPKGVLWKLEGIEIPSPNHFAGVNSLGGGVVTIFSSQLLANSDFYTGAFPAEYNNALAGVFDMKLRNGNNEKREHTFQAGVLGIDIASEGPFKKGNNSSYLFNYRYSTAGLLAEIKVIPIGEQISKYQDLSFKTNFITKNAGTISLWGIGGIDNSQKPEKKDSTVWELEWDRIKQDWKINIGAVGLSHKYILGTQGYLITTIAGSGISNTLDYKRIDDNLYLKPELLIIDNSGKITVSSFVNYKINTRNTIKTGINYHTLFYNLDMNSTINYEPSTYQNFVKETGKSHFTEGYIQIKYAINNTITIYPGISLNYFTLNRDLSVDPRLSLQWEIMKNHVLSAGYGKHSQREELKIYLVRQNINGQNVYPNKNLKLSKAHHFILAYDWQINKNFRLKTEPYFQYLYDIPGKPESSYSMINFKQDWSFRDSLENNCLGKNIGIDITIERFFHKNLYFLITGSIFDSKYKADDGKWRNTRYNKGFVLNILAGKEFNIKKNNILGINGRFNFSGGEMTSPIIEDMSVQEEKVIYNETKTFSKQMPPVKYFDLTITYRINKSNYSGIWALQAKNLLGEPYGGYEYNYKTKKVETNNIVIIIPVLSYKIEF